MFFLLFCYLCLFFNKKKDIDYKKSISTNIVQPLNTTARETPPVARILHRRSRRTRYP